MGWEDHVIIKSAKINNDRNIIKVDGMQVRN